MNGMVNQIDPDNTQYDVEQTTVIPKARETQNVPNQAVYSPETLQHDWMGETPNLMSQQGYLQALNQRPQGFVARWNAMKTWKKVVSILAAAFLVIMGVSAISNVMFFSQVVEVKEPQTVIPYHEEEPAKPNADLNLDGIQGQYWSNAKKILESRNADTSEMVVLTNNGKTPIMDSNWKVTSIEKQDNGQLTVHLEQITDYTGDAADAVKGAGDKLGQAWNDLVEEGQESNTNN